MCYFPLIGDYGFHTNQVSVLRQSQLEGVALNSMEGQLLLSTAQFEEVSLFSTCVIVLMETSYRLAPGIYSPHKMKQPLSNKNISLILLRTQHVVK